MGRAVRVLFRGSGQKTLDGILPDVIFEPLIFERISYPPVKKTSLPDLSLGLQFLVQLKREATFNKLHGPFQSDPGWCQDQMEMVGHDHKLMQQVFLLRSVTQQHLNEETGNLIYLKQASLFQNICGNKIGGFCGQTSMRNRQAAPQRLKPADYSSLTAGLEGLLHPVEEESLVESKGLEGLLTA
jgi:hypothetical protein